MMSRRVDFSVLYLVQTNHTTSMSGFKVVANAVVIVFHCKRYVFQGLTACLVHRMILVWTSSFLSKAPIFFGHDWIYLPTMVDSLYFARVVKT